MVGDMLRGEEAREELLTEIAGLRDLASYAMTILSNVDGGGDFKQSDEWIAAFKKWQKQYIDE